jgi:hypothetical protein
MLIENGREPSLLEWASEVSVSEGRKNGYLSLNM